VKRPDVFLALVLGAAALWWALLRRLRRLRRGVGRVDYHRYMRSARWRAVRLACLAAAGWTCAVVGCWRRAVNAHHPSYERLGRERPGDLVALCLLHHQLIHWRHRRLRRRGVSLRQVTWDVVGGRGWAA
jgi:hypothetical protein